MPQFESPGSQTPSAIEALQKLKKDGKHEEAITKCQELICEDLNCHEAYEELADNLMNLREYEKAAKSLKQALLVNPNSANAHYLLGFCYSAINKWQQSIIHLERANKLEANHPEILRCLGWSVFHGEEKLQGIVIIKRALALAPQDTFILSDLGMCYMSARNFTKAAETFSRILEIDPHDMRAKECMDACKYFLSRNKKES
jgi:tetratricopeptide (TPR) repeat protein